MVKFAPIDRGGPSSFALSWSTWRSQVDTAVLEVDGTVSIIPVSDAKVRTKKGIREI